MAIALRAGSRALPDRSCAWSNVQLSPALVQQIREKLGYDVMEQVAAAA